ncbi:MAG: prepilin-type N-terminal cleavage/methylation domain-containing protein [Intestinibaculum porci]|uniref:prepilin-type N-terminal cleavage/methylation domain-containing protein n=1 Tax=Intestinibaculum porci TaxID=2487118 RepID=UPI003F05BEB1
MLREKLRNKKGFTLIEIIVVIVILAVLMAVAVPSVMSYMSEGENAKYETVARAALINAQTAAAKDYADDGLLNDANNVAKWVDGTANAKYGTTKDYGTDVKVVTTKIVKNTAGDDITSAEFAVSLDDGTTYRTVTANINKKMTVASGTVKNPTEVTGTDYATK